MSSGLPKVYSFSDYKIPSIILVIGCGGTGAYVISHLTRFLSATNSKSKLYIADGDIVEEKNLLRQHFIPQDIGINKAEVLAERYSSVFGIEINAITKDIENLNQFCLPKLNLTYGSMMIIGCVDNNSSRKLIYDFFISSVSSIPLSSIFWIDSGNEEVNGQVVCGINLLYRTYWDAGKYINTPHLSAGRFNTPCVVDLFPEILSDSNSKFNSELSCAERIISSPQNMMTNVTAATLVMNYAQKILCGQPLSSHGVAFSINNTFMTYLNTEQNLVKIKGRK